MNKPLWLDQINSDEWTALCDYAYFGNVEFYMERRVNDLNGTLKLFRDADELGESGVIFCGTTQSIKECLQSIPDTGRYILITRDNDQSVTEELFLLRPKSIKYWFAVNCSVYHPDITAIPFGVATLSGFNETLKLVCENVENIINPFAPNENVLTQPIGKRIYARFNIASEMKYRHERHRCLEMLCNNEIAEINYNNVDAYEMYSQIKKHSFVACPSGTGADTLRIYETLTLGSIPIVTECKELLFFNDMPILYTKDWSFHKDYLRPMPMEYVEQVKSTERIRMSYWINQLNEKRKLIA